MKEIPALYEIAKQITLDAGMPYTDPRTGETTYPEKQKTKARVPLHKRNVMNNKQTGKGK